MVEEHMRRVDRTTRAKWLGDLLDVIDAALYKRHSRSIKSGEGKTRLEAFRDWLEEHPEERFVEMDRQNERALREHLKHARRLDREESKRRRSSKADAALEALEEVPF